MEELLNKLIEKGWRPRGENVVQNSYWIEGNSICWNRGGKASIRELTSKESGLWQFVCENKMIKEGDVKYYLWDKYEHTGFEPLWHIVHKWNTAEYRLIESALKDESELEEFLLNLIIIND